MKEGNKCEFDIVMQKMALPSMALPIINTAFWNNQTIFIFRENLDS